MRIVSKIIAIVLILLTIGVALHQIIVYGVWEWAQMLSINHHEGIATISALLGLLFYLLSVEDRS